MASPEGSTALSNEGSTVAIVVSSVTTGGRVASPEGSTALSNEGSTVAIVVSSVTTGGRVVSPEGVYCGF